MSLTKVLLISFLVMRASAIMSRSSARAEDAATGFLGREYQGPEGDGKYILFLPHAYTGTEKAPLILFLHGAGETGKDGVIQSKVGLGPAIRKNEKSFPFFALFPQSQKRTWKADSTDAQRALAILDKVEKEYKIDGKRIYLTGLSMGGYGTWSLALKYPERWAAIAPVCGGGDPKQADAIKDIPCWCFHGDDDRAVVVGKSRAMMKALWAAGGHPNYTEYPGVGHNSWDRAYSTSDLYEWFLKHKK
jgi:predicted peptidase